MMPYIEGDSSVIYQSITTTRCVLLKLRCAPKELPRSVLVWQVPKNLDRHVYHSLGRYKVSLLDDFVLIPKLCIGGAIQINNTNSLVLDNGYLLQLHEETPSAFHEVLRSARILSDPTPTVPYFALFSAHVALLIEKERSHFFRFLG